MTPERRKYILEHLGKVIAGDNWLRIADFEFDELGGRGFFEGCYIERMHDEKFFTVRVGQRGWDKEQRIQLPWKIHAPVGGGWKPPRPFNSDTFVVTSNAAYFESNCTPTNGTDITMEHHVNRAVIIDVLNAGQERYDDLYRRFKDLYTVKLRARVEAHLDGANINHLSLSLSDAEGNIGLLPNNSDRYEDMILAMELDVREEIVMTEGEFESFAEHKGVDNSKDLELTIERLERLA